MENDQEQDLPPTVKDSRARMSTIGEILVYMARIDQAVLAAALAEQGDTGELLGAVLMRRGDCTCADIEEALAYQDRFRIARTAGEAMAILDEMQARGREAAVDATAELSFMIPPTNHGEH